MATQVATRVADGDGRVIEDMSAIADIGCESEELTPAGQGSHPVAQR